MLTLFHAPQSRSSRLVWLIEELGAEVDIHYCDIRRGDGSGARDPQNPHPEGKVPALLHDGALITESGAVAVYLAGLYPEAGLGFPQGSTERGVLLSWMFWAAGEMEPAFWGRISGATATDPMAQRRYEQATNRLIEALWEGPWLMGDRFTIADVIIGSALTWGRDYLPDSPVFDRYIERLNARPAKVRADARDGDLTLTRAA
ncbi:glutathione S-transferase family protein [Brevundimonas sp.]|jgi:glutathione S-transferase|uniref:glutathione S-transferase family protein n=1 Tax=Brevundimonas sp. TaxID=1871086 RepID=UPI003784A39B